MKKIERKGPMTGQIILEFYGREVPDITIKGEIVPVNINSAERFIRRKWRAHKQALHKENARLKHAVAPEVIAEVKVIVDVPAARIPGVTEPIPVPNPGLDIAPPFDADDPANRIDDDVLVEEETTKISEDKKNDKKRNVGDAKGPRGSAGNEAARGFGTKRSVKTN